MHLSSHGRPQGHSLTNAVMQKTDPLCKCILICLPSGKAPSNEADTFTHINVLDSNLKFLTLVIPKSWLVTVIVEAHDKLGH